MFSSCEKAFLVTIIPELNQNLLGRMDFEIFGLSIFVCVQFYIVENAFGSGRLFCTKCNSIILRVCLEEDIRRFCMMLYNKLGCDLGVHLLFSEFVYNHIEG